MAKCLNLHGENFVEWHYHGADFCHKKSVLPTLDSDELHQVDGDWVMVWMAYNKIMTHDDPWVNFTSSHIELRVQPDNHTVVFHERNIVYVLLTNYSIFCNWVYIVFLNLPESSSNVFWMCCYTSLMMLLWFPVQNLDAEWKPYNDTATADSGLVLVYACSSGRYGHHTDVKDLEKDHEEHKAKAKYLGLSGKNFDGWHYDGAADFCHIKSAPEKADS
uniref:Uncharacterized protein n=1 Tax=Neogobius melanostomus TaxID=47308 RepID=A0A8C6USL7_9GOBI